ncbi:MAG: AAA-like domain-containing protein, partial [Caldilineaceae bacterium]
AWCDYIIVLLSEDSIHSEMVQGEVRRAHKRCEKEGRPTTLPVRVRYEGPLGYELDSYLSPIQQKLWTGADDSEKLLTEILDAAESCASTESAEESEDVSAEASPADPRRPLPAKDPRILRAPGGALRPDDPFYIRREADERIDLVAGSRGETIVIKAPRQMGKSSLLIRYLEACREAGKHFAFVDFQSFGERDLADYGSLLNRLATALLRCFKIPAQQIPRLPDQLAFTNFVEDTILANVPGPTTFAFDEVDRILGRPYQSDFFAMLRMWHNNRAQPLSVWESVDLALVIATEPYLLIDVADQSPFNVSVPITLQGFSQEAIVQLNAAYGDALNPMDLDALFDLLAGQPYLTRLALYYIVGPPAMSFADLTAQATSSEGPFGDHLKALLFKLERYPGLLDALRQAIREGTLPDDQTYYRLRGAGLLTRDDSRIRPTNMLYARFFGEVG